MLKRLLIAIVVAALAMVAQPALAGKKKPKPWKSEQVTLAVPHPVVYNSTGSVNSITAKEFESKCSLPASNGLDGYVFEVPKDYQKIQAHVAAIGAAAETPAAYDLDLYFYDSKCTVTLVSQAVGTDENSVIPAGTAWIFMHNYLGEPGVSAHLELKPY
jgi:hypothetical protein